MKMHAFVDGNVYVMFISSPAIIDWTLQFFIERNKNLSINRAPMAPDATGTSGQPATMACILKSKGARLCVCLWEQASEASK